MPIRNHRWRTPAAAFGVLLAGCAGQAPYRLPFMTPPAYASGDTLPPFRDTARVGTTPMPSILYATVRRPAPADARTAYGTERATAVRVGVADIAVGDGAVTWDEARQVALLKTDGDRYPVRVAAVHEYGKLDRTERMLLQDTATHVGDPAPRQAFIAEVNARLAKRRVRDIYVYVHGYRTGFENPVLVAAELWHFLGYEGVFIPFAWPANLGRLDYFADTENSRYSAPFLRDFLAMLADETTAERIHIVGYSAGTRLVAATLHQLALQTSHLAEDETRRRTKLGNVLLVASDIDRGIFEGYLDDGLERVQRRLTLYESPSDKALGMSRFFYGRRRIGQLELEHFQPEAAARLRRDSSLVLVSVARALGADDGNGHGYFRRSPWVSADILMTLRYDLSPAARGLEMHPDAPVWRFPADYEGRLKASLEAVRAAGSAARP